MERKLYREGLSVVRLHIFIDFACIYDTMEKNRTEINRWRGKREKNVWSERIKNGDNVENVSRIRRKHGRNGRDIS